MVFSFRASMAPWAASSCYFRLLLKALLLYSRDFLNHRDDATRSGISSTSFAQFPDSPGKMIRLRSGFISFARHAASARDQMDRHLVCFVTETHPVIGK